MVNVIWIEYLKPSTATGTLFLGAQSSVAANVDVSCDMHPLTPVSKPEPMNGTHEWNP